MSELDATLRRCLLKSNSAETFPWWPAVIFEEDDPEVPENISSQRKELSPDSVLLLVRFFDVKQSWCELIFHFGAASWN